MLPSWFVIIAIGFRLIGGAGYIRSVARGKTKPNPITWFVWALTALIAFIAQLHEGVGVQAWVTFALAVGPLLIFCISLAKSRQASHFTFFNCCCGSLALTGIILWQATDNALLAIVCSILADICGSLPTIRKSLHDPHSETPLPFLMSALSMALTIATLREFTLPAVLFPAYIMAINLTIYGSIAYGYRLQRTARPVRRRAPRHLQS